MTSKKLQKKWEREADENFPEIAEILKIFADNYGPSLIANFFSATKERTNEIVGAEAKLTKVLGLFVETWRLAIEKDLPPCGMADWMDLLSKSTFTWEDSECKGVNIDTLREVWRGSGEFTPEKKITKSRRTR